MSPAW